ncbi:uncharacterized protein EV154DRAFT_572498 [Mucor mucedo]|uniref:uncharacterized protein n=1 Tax=Mucor mucedo TaxID=29922 RepID=UPI00221E9EC7|nr:uncharacterized protein EV154DRAFT_572498 [Mucor mucedo]KAI7864304.1 hypothetical protein EV154DRAFT_572498 [Mucor mucedo]
MISAHELKVEINAPLARAYDVPNLKVDGTRISASARLAMAGLNFTIYASNYHFVHYMIKNMLPGSYHRVTGVFSASAYISQTSTRAMLSIRVSPPSLRPLRWIVAPPPPTPSKWRIRPPPPPTTTTTAAAPPPPKIAFAEKLLSLYDRLLQQAMITGPGAVSPPVSIQDATLETRSSLRPGTKKTTVKEVVLGTYPAVNMTTNIDDSPLVVPLPPPPPSPKQQQQQQHHAQEPMLD